MLYTMTLELPEEIYSPLAESAGSSGKTPEEIALHCLADAAQQIQSQKNTKSNGQSSLGLGSKVRPANPIDLSREMNWMKQHRDEYVGRWVALDGDRLVAQGTDAREVYETARQSGIEIPFLAHVDPPDPNPFGGW